ncbi:DUF805 domain-containing protein [Pontibacter qinzhouensis]|uniref:DUF805 domain-containing protein n=1 Tax=Pontibacter qinzhouensis TaxID=2603253 RepID=A0A5C8KDG9_9BACT|nr:DUF805 domain-containing protein [Pontibacter qinzhouensis]TXK49270.1 DUF805 domain-containing protein [Pontibacter qinzhouensis]
MNWYMMVLRKYAEFSGRARRSEYWYFFLFNILVSMALAGVDFIIGSALMGGSIGLLGGLYSLAVFIPGLAVSVRRLHDTGRSGWWLLISLVPFIGWIVLIVFMFTDSQYDDNQYGPNLKVDYQYGV